jgi:hypothetical protein
VNQAGDVSVIGRTNLLGPVTIGKAFNAVEAHPTSGGYTPQIDISGTMNFTSVIQDFTEKPKIKLISQAIGSGFAKPDNTTLQSANEIVGVGKNNSGFLRLSAENSTKSSIDLISATSSSGYTNSIRFVTGSSERMLIDGNGNVSVYNTPTSNYHVANKAYVDTKTTDTVTTALSSSGTMTNNPTVAASANPAQDFYLLYTNVRSGRATLQNDGELYYNPSSNTLYATAFSGNATSATTATTSTYASRATSNKFSINGGSSYADDILVDTMFDIYDKGWGQGTRIRMRSVYGNNFTIGTGHNDGECYVWNERATDLVFGTSSSKRMTINSTGYVGIGTSSPTYPLHVATASSNFVPFGNFYFTYPTGAVNLLAGGNYSFSIHSAYGIQVGSYIVFYSDKRIKKNVKDIDGNTALSQIRQIRPKTYNYIDYRSGNGDVYGFIAQDVKDVILNSTTCSKNYIPNFYCKGNIRAIDASNHIYEISSENDLSFDKVIDDSGNEVIHHKIKIYGFDDTEYICSVIQMNNTKNIRVKLEKEYKFANDEENKYKLFIYGQEIYDFYSLEKNAIWTVATAALQEVDRQQQADKVRIAELETKVAEQQSLINDILERLKKVGV